MASITRVRIKKCGVRDQLLDVVCNQPRDHGGNHRYSEGPDLQFTWLNVEEKKMKPNYNFPLLPEDDESW